MTDEKSSADAEFAAMHAVYSALQQLTPEAQSRVVNYIVDRLDLSAPTRKGKTQKDVEQPEEDGEEQEAVGAEMAVPITFKTFAELYDAAQPQTTAQKALLAGYWIQVCQGNETFDGHRANKELNHLGERIPNITNAVASLNAQKPSLAIQIKKSGNSQQARKTYKVTVAGENAVKAMLNG